MSARALLLASLAAGCAPTATFRCEVAADCLAGTRAGVCEPTGFCSFEDVDCGSGRRYGELAGDGLADACVAGADARPTIDGGSLEAALVGHWPLDEDVLDVSGHGFDGVIQGDPAFVPGVIGGAIELDGDDRFTVAELSGLGGSSFPATQGSLTFHLRDDGSPPGSGTGYLAHYGGEDQLFVRPSADGEIQVAAQRGDDSYAATLPLSFPSGWHLVVVRWDFVETGNLWLYVSGVGGGAALINDAFAATDQEFVIGNDVVGLIDDLRLYDRPISDDEMATLP